ncbi:MAG: hypothetical protein NTZ10_00885 [Candidatus Saganbacteria bacterium]|nr:hypothetical protein [Candidatus Saganbacteria bacterium]
MKNTTIDYLKWILEEINASLEMNPFTRQLYSPFAVDEIVEKDGTLAQTERLLVASEVYRWVMGGKWRLLDLEHLIKTQRGHLDFDKKTIKQDIKHLIDQQDLLNEDVLQMVLLLTGIDKRIVENAKYVIQNKFFITANPNKLWSSIGYYDMKNKSIHVSTGGKAKDGKYKFPVEDVIETAAHELGHHIYISMISGKFKTPKGTIRKIRGMLKGVKTSKNDLEHNQWLKFYKEDYESDWRSNKAVQIVPVEAYVKYGIENELFAQTISGKTTISKSKRKQLIKLINESCIF